MFMASSVNPASNISINLVVSTSKNPLSSSSQPILGALSALQNCSVTSTNMRSKRAELICHGILGNGSNCGSPGGRGDKLFEVAAVVIFTPFFLYIARMLV